MGAAVAGAVAEGFTHVAFGDLFLEDMRRYREERLAGTGPDAALSALAEPTTATSRAQMIAAGLSARLTLRGSRACSTESFAGREFDHALLADLPAGRGPVRRERRVSLVSSGTGRCSARRVPIETGMVVDATASCSPICARAGR